jgi:hypothetical protein
MLSQQEATASRGGRDNMDEQRPSDGHHPRLFELWLAVKTSGYEYVSEIAGFAHGWELRASGSCASVRAKQNKSLARDVDGPLSIRFSLPVPFEIVHGPRQLLGCPKQGNQQIHGQRPGEALIKEKF